MVFYYDLSDMKSETRGLGGVIYRIVFVQEPACGNRRYIRSFISEYDPSVIEKAYIKIICGVFNRISYYILEDPVGILAVDIGNMNMTLGVYAGEELVGTFRITTRTPRVV